MKLLNKIAFKESTAKVLFLVAACVSIAAVVTICVFLFSKAIPAILTIGPINFLFGKVWRPANDLYGIFPMILGSIYVTIGAIIIGVPIGVLTAIFLAHFAPKHLKKPIETAVNLLAELGNKDFEYFVPNPSFGEKIKEDKS